MPESDYGSEYHAHVLEIYKMFVDSTNLVGDRRARANNFLLTVNGALVTLSGLVGSFGADDAVRFVVPVAGAAVSASWLILIRRYRALNEAKFGVIGELEAQLPVAPFEREWERAHSGPKRHVRLTRVEESVPLIFVAVYIALIGFFAA